ncbi:partner of Y14 and mago-like [Helianthus annuus]|uniref:partner of Y14 and mago-like n=1 Tax=Helianthus annuus TaxID=4232 RepID=UPI0016530DD9|nr:partner of Y14 and mago-like [Helianthus annuus]
MVRSGGGEDEAKEMVVELTKTLKEGERLVSPTRRPDETLRKPIPIKAGYTLQDEVAIYKSKGALVYYAPSYDPEVDVSKPKTKSAKRNERKKEKHLLVCHLTFVYVRIVV